MIERKRAINVLFLCTHNSGRSIMAEGLLNALGSGRFKAFSAGSHPSGKPNALAIDALRRMDVDTRGLRSKSWDEFGAGASPMDIVITVCDNAAREMCPVWPGAPVAVHWGIEDPADAAGSDDEKLHRFLATAQVLKERIERMIALPVEQLDAQALRCELDRIASA